MAGQIFGGPATVSGTATTLTTLLSLGQKQFFTNLLMRCSAANVGTVWIGKSNVTTVANQLGFLDATEWISVDVIGHYTSTDELYLIGTPGDIVHVLIVS